MHKPQRYKMLLFLATSLLWFAYAWYDSNDSALPTPAAIPSQNGTR